MERQKTYGEEIADTEIKLAETDKEELAKASAQADYLVENFPPVGMKMDINGLEFVVGEINAGDGTTMPCFVAELIGMKMPVPEKGDG